MSFTPSKYQEDIFSWFESGSGNVAIDAVAGAGKTSSIVRGMDKANSNDAFFAAFNKSIVEELRVRLNGSANCDTIHAMGYKALQRGLNLPSNAWKVEAAKYRQMSRQLDIPVGDRFAIQDCVAALVNFAQITLCEIDPESIDEMATRFQIEIPEMPGMSRRQVIEYLAQGVDAMLKKGLEETKQGLVSFGDMLYAPIVLGLPIKQYSLVAVDESQDLSNVQRELVSRAVRPDGRLVAVGDPRQAIYFFAGAEADSFDRIRDLFSAQTLPLSICYRCPSSVIQLAQSIVPQIEAAPHAPAGIVRDIPDTQIEKELKAGDMVLCRMTAPLVKLCFKLLSQRIQARIKGRDVGASLTAVVKQVGKKRGFTFGEFPVFLEEWRDGQVRILQQKVGTESQIESVNDKYEALMVCLGSFLPISVEGFCREIEGLFSDQKAAITLSTIHRAKGLENRRVFIIRPEKLPLVWKGQSPEQFSQEMNLKYVAITRAQEELVFVRTEES